MKNPTFLAAAVLLATIGCTIARADSAAGSPSVTVRYADLDTGGAGAAVLFRRIETAAAEVCKELQPGRSLARIRPYADCMQRAIGNAVVRVARPAVTAYAAAHGVNMEDPGVKIASN